MLKAKKIIYILCAALLCLALFSCTEEKPSDDDFSYESVNPSQHNDASTYNGFTYTVYAESHVVIEGYEGSAAKAVVPSEIKGLPVTEIADRACYENHKLTSVEIPDSVTKIGEEAFFGCSALTDVSLSPTLSRLGDRAFTGTPFVVGNETEFLIVGDGILIDYDGIGPVVNVPDGVRVISGAFENNALITDVILPDSVTEIAGYSFISCTQLKSVNIPESVTAIGKWAFAKCISLSQINIPENVISIGERCYLYCSSAERLTISARLGNIPVSAFQSCTALTEVVLPDSVSVISDNAFLRCSSLTRLSIPDSVGTIGEMAFVNCSPELTVICSDGSTAAQYCDKEGISHTTP